MQKMHIWLVFIVKKAYLMYYISNKFACANKKYYICKRMNNHKYNIIMKHYSLLLFLVPMMCACTTSNLEGNVNTENQMVFCAIQNVLQQHIERISIEYIERQEVVLYTADLPTDDDKQGDDTKEMKKQDDNVATMDGIGFLTGVLADGEIGIFVGGVLGSAPGVIGRSN